MYTKKLKIRSKHETRVIDVSDTINDCIAESGLANGIVSVHAYRSTCAIGTVEYEPGLEKDLQGLFEKLAPRNDHYHHEETWHDGNGFSHVRSSLFGTSQSFNLIDGSLYVYPWQQIIFMDFAPQGDDKEFSVVIVGE